MKITTTLSHGIFSLYLISILLSSYITTQAQAQSPPGWGPNRSTNLYPYSRFSSSLAIIVAVLVTSIFFMIFFFIYIRYCTTTTLATDRPVVVRATAAVRGLDASVIETFPIFSYSEVKDHQIGKGALECAVCLNEFEDDETLRLIPKCDHVFHPECIDAWLKSHVTCPVCRADLVPRVGESPVQIPGSTGVIDEECVEEDNVGERSSRNDEIVIQIDDESLHSGRPPRAVNRNLSFQYPIRPSKTMVNRNLSFGNLNWAPNRVMNRNVSFGNRNHVRSSPMRPRMFGLGKLGRSRSVGNLLVRPGDDLERFTLRLPSDVRKEVMHRAALNRTMSFVIATPRESFGKSKTIVGTEGKIRTDEIGRDVKSDRWDFFTRALSMTLRSPRGVPQTGESSSTSTSNGVGTRSLNKLRSFNCLEPRAVDETGFSSAEPVKSTV